jgi:hypothetical protein
LPNPALCVVISNNGDNPIQVSFLSTLDNRPVGRQVLSGEVIRVATFDHSIGILSATVLSTQSTPYRIWWSPSEIIVPTLTDGQAFSGWVMVLWPVAIIDEPCQAHKSCE